MTEENKIAVPDLEGSGEIRLITPAYNNLSDMVNDFPIDNNRVREPKDVPFGGY